MFNGVKALIRGTKMAEETKEVAAKNAAKEDLAKRGPGRPKGSGKRGRPKGSKNKKKGKVGRPRLKDEVTPKSLVGAVKRGPGRPPKAEVEGVAKRKPGRPKRSGKGKPGRPKGSGKKRGRKPGRKAAVVPKGFIKKAEAKRLVKAAVANLKATLPKVIRKELLKLLK